MKKLLILIVFLLTALLMVFTNPDKKAHKNAMMEAIGEYVQEETESRLGNNVLADLSSVLANNSAKAFLNYKLKHHDYYFFSTTSMKMDGKEQLMSVGLFGHVFTFDKEMLEEHLEKAENSDSNDEN